MNNQVQRIHRELGALHRTMDTLLRDCESILNNEDGLADAETRFLVDTMNLVSYYLDKVKGIT